jgi:hypothetical protein
MLHSFFTFFGVDFVLLSVYLCRAAAGINRRRTTLTAADAGITFDSAGSGLS